MSPEQEKQWKDYACIPRCIIKLTELNGHPITADDFRTRFEHLFPDPNKEYGLFPLQLVPSILKSLQLPERVTSSHDYSTVESALKNKQFVLMMSHVDLNPGGTGEINHCSVLTKMDATAFAIWTPSQSGRDHSLNYNAADWKDKKCWGYIIG